MMVINLSGALMDKIRIQMRQCIHFFERVFIIQIIMIQCNSRAGQLSESKPYSLFFFFYNYWRLFSGKELHKPFRISTCPAFPYAVNVWKAVHSFLLRFFEITV